jgi:hypothetical protein
MSDPAISLLDRWDNFYVIIGSSAAALTGLQFVVMALIGERRRPDAEREALDAFATPTVVHFSAVVLIAAILTAPWPSLASLAYAAGAAGSAGVVYVAIVTLRSRRQHVYAPVMEDWIFHTILPLVAYVIIAVSAAELVRYEAAALFLVGAGVLILLFTGIHNAWDNAVFIALDERSPKP